MKLSEKDWFCKESVYADWYTCKECGYSNISNLTQFCPNCGAKIEWEENNESL